MNKGKLTKSNKKEYVLIFLEQKVKATEEGLRFLGNGLWLAGLWLADLWFVARQQHSCASQPQTTNQPTTN
ncbi:hypothetical protein GCM10028818_48780 [Spirosoma horti]